MKEHKYRLGITAEEYFIKRIFRDTSRNNNDIKKFGLLEYLNKNYRANGRSEELFKKRIYKVQKDLEDMYNGKIAKNIKLRALNIMRKKDKILENFINAIDKFTDIDIQNQDYKKLLECRNKFKKYDEEDKLYSLNTDFDIKVFIKMLYDQEIYVIKYDYMYKMIVSWREKGVLALSTSRDGINWSNLKIILNKGNKQSWESIVNRGCLLIINNKYYLWYIVNPIYRKTRNSSTPK